MKYRIVTVPSISGTYTFYQVEREERILFFLPTRWMCQGLFTKLEQAEGFINTEIAGRSRKIVAEYYEQDGKVTRVLGKTNEL